MQSLSLLNFNSIIWLLTWSVSMCLCIVFSCVRVYVFQMACEKLLDVVSGLVPPNYEPSKVAEDQGRIKGKIRKSKDWIFIFFCKATFLFNKR